MASCFPPGGAEPISSPVVRATVNPDADDALHRRLLRRALVTSTLGAGALLGLVALLPAMVVLSFRGAGLGSRGELLVATPVVLAWMWWLRRMPGRWLRVRRDLAEGGVLERVGPVWVESRSSPGLLPVRRYTLRLDDEQFPVGAELAAQVTPGATYRLRTSREAAVLLAAQLLDGTAARPVLRDPEGAAAAPAPHDLAPRPPVTPEVERAPSGVAAAPTLGSREAEVLCLIAEGRSNKEIASALHLSVNTVKMYTSQLYRKLGVRRRTEAVRRARQVGLI